MAWVDCNSCGQELIDANTRVVSLSDIVVLCLEQHSKLMKVV